MGSLTDVREVEVLGSGRKNSLPAALSLFSSIDCYRTELFKNVTHSETNNSTFTWRACHNIFKRVKEILMQNSQGNNSHHGDFSVSNDHYYFRIASDLRQKHHFYDCIDEVGEVLDMSAKELEKISMDVGKILRLSRSTDKSGYWDIMRGDLDRLNATAMWLSEQALSYAVNKTTKIELSSLIGRDMLPTMVSLVDHTISVIMVKGIDPLLQKANALERNAYRWYKKACDILLLSVPRYEDRGVKYLNIWRHPVALLETEDILKFKYSVSDAWQSWKRSGNLENFISSGEAWRLVLDITTAFANTLHVELTRIEVLFRNARNEVIESFTDVINHLTDIQREISTSSDEFIL